MKFISRDPRNVKEQRETLGLTQKEFSERFGIPLRTIQSWEGGERNPPEYVTTMLAYIIYVNRHVKTGSALSYDFFIGVNDSKENIPLKIPSDDGSFRVISTGALSLMPPDVRTLTLETSSGIATPEEVAEYAKRREQQVKERRKNPPVRSPEMQEFAKEFTAFLEKRFKELELDKALESMQKQSSEFLRVAETRETYNAGPATENDSDK